MSRVVRTIGNPISSAFHLAALLGLILTAPGFAQTYNIKTFAGGAVPENLQANSASLGAVGSTAMNEAVDLAGNVYLSLQNYHIVVRLDTKAGTLTPVAGTGTAGFSGDNGPATNAQLNRPAGLTVDTSGNLYIADSGNSRIRKVANGTITTVAGNGKFGFSGDSGSAVAAALNSPVAVAIDSAGSLYIGDLGNNRVRKVSNGTITTIAGNGGASGNGDNGPAQNAVLSAPEGVAVDSAGNVYIADTNDNAVRMISNGIITTVAGTGAAGFSGDNGPATAAQLSAPYGVTVDTSGILYIADRYNNRIRRVANGMITTVAGNGAAGFSGDGGQATEASLDLPGAVGVDSSGKLFIADNGNARLRRVSVGVIATVAGGGPAQGDTGLALNVQLFAPDGIALDNSGNVYVADTGYNRIRKISGGNIATVAGNGNQGSGGDNGIATSAQLHFPSGVAVDGAGNIFIADTFNHRIREVSNGVITTVAGNGTHGFSGDNGPATSAELFLPLGVAVDGAGSLYIADAGNYRIRKVSNGTITTLAGNGNQGAGGDGGPAVNAQLGAPQGVAVDAAGNVFIADTENNRIREVSNGTITTIAGNGTPGFAGDQGPATNAELNSPVAVAVDIHGNLFIADTANNRIREVSGGNISTIAGGGSSFGDGGPATGALLSGPQGIGIDGSGNIYFAEFGNNRVRLLQPALQAGLSIASAHSGNFVLGQSGTYTITVTNAPTAAPASGTVTVAETTPDGLTLASMSGTGWTCSGNTCTRSDALNPGSSYPPITVTVNVASNAPAQITNQVSVSGGGGPSASATDLTAVVTTATSTVSLAAVQNAASFAPGQVVPGEIVILYGSGMGPAQMTFFQATSAGFVSTQVAGTQVIFDGVVAAPIIFTQADLVAVVVPYEVTGNTTSIVVQYQGQSSNTLTVPVTAALPGIFTATGSGTGQAAAVNQNGSYNSLTPARPGDVISLYATGEGQTSPAGVDGKPATEPLPHPIQNVTVTIGGVQAEVLYAGAAPFEVEGLMVVNARIPASVSPGNAPVTIAVGGVNSQAGVTISIASSQ